MNQIEIVQILELKVESINHLLDESLVQGFNLIKSLIKEYNNGLNRFDRSGEILLVASVKSKIVGIGGLNICPYSNDPKIGRLRHLYVESVWRRHGIGRSLVEHLIHEAKQHYQLLTLRTNTIEGAEFYQKLGFKTYPNFQYMTHYLQLSEMEYYSSNSLDSLSIKHINI